MLSIYIKSEKMTKMPDFLFIKGEIKCSDIRGKKYSIKIRNGKELFIDDEENFDPFEVELIKDMEIELNQDHIVLNIVSEKTNYKLYIK